MQIYFTSDGWSLSIPKKITHTYSPTYIVYIGSLTNCFFPQSLFWIRKRRKKMTSLIISWFKNISSGFLTTFLLLLSLRSFADSSSFSHSSNLHPLIKDSQAHHHNFTGVSDFRVLNRRFLGDCPDLNPYQEIKVVSGPKLGDEQHVTVTVSGVLFPSELDWIGMISPSHSE